MFQGSVRGIFASPLGAQVVTASARALSRVLRERLIACQEEKDSSTHDLSVDGAVGDKGCQNWSFPEIVS